MLRIAPKPLSPTRERHTARGARKVACSNTHRKPLPGSSRLRKLRKTDWRVRTHLRALSQRVRQNNRAATS
eukprot:8868554-Alexandrium_andersonii.AAC.1